MAKIVIWLVVLSFFLSIIASFFIGGDFEALGGNVAVIEINGPIVMESDDFLFESAASSEDIADLIKEADENNGIKAIVLAINSPGGSAVASEEIANEIKKTNKTTVAWIKETGTSGAYWIASSTDHIVANRMSITGSIGVIASYLGFSGFIQDHNVTYERLVSGNLKDMGSPLKEMTQEERMLFQKSLQSIHDYFVEQVAENRGMSKKDVERLATGQFYIGEEAKKLGLVDELGSKEEVVNYIYGKIGEDVVFVDYETDKGFFSSFGSAINRNSFYIGKGIGSSLVAKSNMPERIMT